MFILLLSESERAVVSFVISNLWGILLSRELNLLPQGPSPDLVRVGGELCAEAAVNKEAVEAAIDQQLK